MDEEVGAETKEELDYVEETPSDMEISVRALTGGISYTTLRVGFCEEETTHYFN